MAYTGGALNELNGKMGISAPYKSVPVMKLIRAHNPRSKDELAELIEYHYKHECECGIRSTGTVEDFGKNLYNSQLAYWGVIRYSLLDCMRWEYDLFINQSLKGDLIEKKAIREIQDRLPQLRIVETEGFLDEEFRIDIIVKNKSNEELAGVQVKPSTFNKMRKEVVEFQRIANAKWGKPVFFLIYNANEEFNNLDDVINKIKELE